MSTEFSFQCSACNEVHHGIPDLVFDCPIYYHQMSEADRRAKATLTEDTCVIADEDFFVRGALEIPIHGRDETFAYSVWVSLSAGNFDRYEALFEKEEPDEAPYFGWLSSWIPGYADTLSLKTKVHLRPFPQRPRIELEPTKHRLAIDQREGIDIERLEHLIQLALHPGNEDITR